MNRSNYFIHLFVLFIFQLIIMNNIYLGSYFYVNIYILSIYILPYKLKGISLLLCGFALGFIMDLANNTPGIHAAATTFITYLRPWLLQWAINREEIENNRKWTDIGWFMKYTGWSTFLFYLVLMFCEAFTFSDIHITLIRIILSSLLSWLFIILYYFIALKKVHK